MGNGAKGVGWVWEAHGTDPQGHAYTHRTHNKPLMDHDLRELRKRGYKMGQPRAVIGTKKIS